MKISIISVGKIKEKYLKDAISEYKKRISRFADVNLIEVQDEKAPEDLSKGEEDIIKKKEADKILRKIDGHSYLIILDLIGKKISSEEFAKKIQELMIYGKSKITFVIGGSLGIHETLLRKADFIFSMSDLTFPHQLIRVFLIEQIFRCFKIINNEAYHK